MKATFFSIAALAATALAAPFRPEARQIGDINAVGDALEIVDGVAVDDLGVGEIANNVIDTPLKRADVANVGDVIILITSLTEGVTTHTGAINKTLAAVQGGELSKDDAAKQVTEQLQGVHFKLTDVVTKLVGAGGLDVSDADLDKVLTLVVALVSEVLATVKALVTILGIRAELISILHSVFNIVSSLLATLVGLLAGLLPGLLAVLSPLLAGLGNGLLAPLLAPIVALLAALSAPGGLPL
ncbi:hypothetical protein VFPBJ_08742 [Purpureocillium lilacinum]|uniref:Uncharacterized protein n=1 Tax=Purpureocillium lilacinum TaxID=33203 RepID=A0A179GEX1_PURLI|nr:hypothetical protein VFPBJ_08742 [Purpureocillium lilacinum]